VRVLLGVSAVFAALVLTGCGGDEAGVAGSAAGVVPANVALYATLNTDFEGDEWQQAEELVRRFPDGDRAIRELLATIEDEDDIDFEQDVKPAFGPEVAVVVLDFAADDPAFVGLTQPRDPQKFDELLAQGDEPAVSEEFEGWTVFSDEQASIDAFKQASGGDTLADSDAFAEALDGLDEGLVSVYVSGDALRRAAQQDPSFDPASVEALLPNGEFPTMGITVGADDDGGRLDGQFVFGGDVEESGLAGEPFAAELPDELPGGVLAYVGFNDLEQQISRFRDALAEIDPEVESQLGQIEGTLGVSLEEDIAPLFAGEGAFYVRPGSPLPELTLVTNVEDEQQAVGTVDDLVEGIGGFVPVPPPEDTEIAGVQARQLVLEPPVTLFYAAFDGKLVLTTSRDGIADLREEGDRLSDDESFTDALDQAGVPDETTGLAYVNLAEVVPLLLNYADASGEEIPPEVRANTEPLRAFVAYGTAEGDTVTFSAFLGVE
jgi:hypothetical protein